ncbi:hypothetical protein KVR01_010221 [Diaporthe batatas]|uniref:uncharacterized protein n=1 Tax=Diaporthe batatas TaxID=748121 RepID=UPI001D0391EE|nr:uncharacterized protein KVR01_010221 [Diaporthe batatas]KAG8159584.1 hypothetical protein KVR01_010221 [Diaporthe batatas]
MPALFSAKVDFTHNYAHKPWIPYILSQSAQKRPRWPKRTTKRIIIISSPRHSRQANIRIDSVHHILQNPSIISLLIDQTPQINSPSVKSVANCIKVHSFPSAIPGVRSFTNHRAGECRYKNAPRQPQPTNNCSYCGKKGHDESVCYKKNPNKRQNNPARISFTQKSLTMTVRREGRWEMPLDCQRERGQSAVSFPLRLAGTMALPPQEYGLTSNAWLEDSDHDAIMCLHDCRSGGNFCCRRFAVKCANQLKQGTRHLHPGVTNPEQARLVISQRDEEALRQTMSSYGVPSNGFGQPMLMDIDEVY